MKTRIVVSSAYGFDHNWTLICQTPKTTKAFYLGQDVKFCHRVLGMSGREVAAEIGTNRLDTEAGQVKLAKYICKRLGLNGHTIKKYTLWDLAAN